MNTKSEIQGDKIVLFGQTAWTRLIAALLNALGGQVAPEGLRLFSLLEVSESKEDQETDQKNTVFSLTFIDVH